MKRYIFAIIAAWLVAIAPFIIFGQDVNMLTTAALPAETEATEEIPYLSYFMKFNQVMHGLPALPLVLIGCCMVGYFVKLLPVVPNRWIPFYVFLFGIVANLVITPPKNSEILGRAIIYGLVCGGLSIFIHRKWLRSWIDIDVFDSIGKPPEK